MTGSTARPRLVSAKGFAERADVRVPDEFTTGAYRPVALEPDEYCRRHGRRAAAAVSRGAVVWVKTDFLHAFCTEVLPAVDAPFVLVTGDWDYPVPSYYRGEAATLLGDSRVRHWFTMHLDGSERSERLSPIPLGVDYHTLSRGPAWGESRQSRADQEATLLAVAATLAPLGERDPMAWADFGWRRDEGLVEFGQRKHRRPDRAKQADRFDSMPAVHVQNEPLTRTGLWCGRGSTAAVVCPQGYGQDTHRTWEALALGHLAIVMRSALSPLYENLAVAEVDDWEEVTPAAVVEWIAASAARAPRPGEVPAELTMNHWMAVVDAERGRGDRVVADPTESKGALVADVVVLAPQESTRAAQVVAALREGDAVVHRSVPGAALPDDSVGTGVVSIGAAAVAAGRSTANERGVPWAADLGEGDSVDVTDTAAVAAADLVIVTSLGVAAQLASAGVEPRRTVVDAALPADVGPTADGGAAASNWATVLGVLGHHREAPADSGDTHSGVEGAVIRADGLEIATADHAAAVLLHHEVFVDRSYDKFAGDHCELIIDGGANAGTAACRLAAVHPEAHIECYEPDPVAFALLEQNLAANDLTDRVTATAAALSDVEGTVTFHTSAEGLAPLRMSLDQERMGPYGRPIPVPAIRLSDRIGDRTVDLLKLDIEGAEFSVIHDLDSSGALRQVRRLVMEVHHRAGLGDRVAELLSVLDRHEFGFLIEARAGDGVSHRDGEQDLLLWGEQLAPLVP